MMCDFEIGINKYNSTNRYSLYINAGLVRENIRDIEELVKEIKKYLRLRFKEQIK